MSFFCQRLIVVRLGRASHAEVVEDRRVAIAQAVAEASPRDVIVLAGKGHEDYQEIAGVRHPFSDVIEATQALMQRGAGRRAAPSPVHPSGGGRAAPSGPKDSR